MYRQQLQLTKCTTLTYLNPIKADTGPVPKAMCAYERLAGLF
jgi:hypothetical protein